MALSHTVTEHVIACLFNLQKPKCKNHKLWFCSYMLFPVFMLGNANRLLAVASYSVQT